MAGAAFTLVTPTDEVMVRKIETILKQRIQRQRLAGISDAVPGTGLPDVEAMRRYLEAKRNSGGQAAPAKPRLDPAKASSPRRPG